MKTTIKLTYDFPKIAQTLINSLKLDPEVEVTATVNYDGVRLTSIELSYEEETTLLDGTEITDAGNN